jgi:hypothetical protein
MHTNKYINIFTCSGRGTIHNVGNACCKTCNYSRKLGGTLSPYITIERVLILLINTILHFTIHKISRTESRVQGLG